jgi:class 3 adenylate cyclase
MTENLEPEDTVHLLNEYFSEMTKLIFKHGGTIDKFMGDGILAFYGDPLECKDHAEKAVRTAIEMKDVLKLLQSRWKDMNCELHVTVGICTGYVTVGNIGSKERMEYTVIGNHVNLAQRLQSDAQTSQILINQRTFSMVKDTFETEIIQNIYLKGINKSVVAYSVLGYK